MAHLQSDMQLEDYKVILRSVMAGGVGTEVFVRNMNGAGGARDYAFHLVPERDADGLVVGVLAIGRNITALKETERRLSESQQQLRQLATRSEAVREEERKYLTREIHDELGQYLSALRLGVSVLEMQFGSANPALAERTRALTGLVDSTIQVVRNIVGRLRPGALDMGIVSALEWLVEQFRENNEASCQLHVDEARIQLDEVRATELFRIVQESLTNIRKYARASHVSVSLKLQRDDMLVLRIIDDGIGIAAPTLAKPMSHGLLGMRERALLLGGILNIRRGRGDRGTCIEVYIPLRGRGKRPAGVPPAILPSSKLHQRAGDHTPPSPPYSIRPHNVPDLHDQ